MSASKINAPLHESQGRFLYGAVVTGWSRGAYRERLVRSGGPAIAVLVTGTHSRYPAAVRAQRCFSTRLYGAYS